MHRATSEEEALNLLFLGDTNRAISETAMNQASSRSHLGVLRCGGAFTPSTRVVSRNDGSGWSLF